MTASPGICQRDGCLNPKPPGHGVKLCVKHQATSLRENLERKNDRNRLPCQYPGCTDEKQRGPGQRHCTKHRAEGPRRESEQVVRRMRERKYGLPHDEYLALLEAQGGVCAICGNGEQKRQLAVDHDHETGKIRGLLCDRCNPLLGYAHDDTAVLKAAVVYLKKHATTRSN